MRIVALVAAAVIAAAPLHANEVSIAFSKPPTSPVTVELRHVTRVSDLAGPAAVVRQTVLDAPVVVDLAPGTWAIDVRGAGVWHAQQTFVVSSDHTDVMANIWPAAIVRGRLDVEGSKEAVVLRASFAPSDGAAAPVGTVDCNEEKREFECKLPAAALDTRLRIRGYVTKFFWNQNLAAAKSVDVGTLRYVRGAVLLGRVEIAPEVPIAMREVRISATPANADEAAKKIAIATPAESRGFFNVDGLPPGRYEVVAIGKKYRSRPISVVVLPGLTAEMRDVLSVEAPKTLHVAVTPPLDPAGKPWQVTISQHLSEHHVEPISGSRANASGEWSSPAIYAGTYQLTVAAFDGSRWFIDDVLTGDADMTRNIDLTAQHVNAIVTLGGKPLRGTVSLAAGVSSISFDTDDAGTWHGVLPTSAEKWDANVTSDTPPVRRSMRGLTLKHGTDSRDAELRIDLPLNAIMGTVARKDGQPIDNALVRISGVEGLQSVNVEADGSFFAAGLGAGHYTVSATAFLMDSPAVDVAIDDGSVPDPIRLVLDNSTKIHGQVMSHFGAVAGAQVVVASTDVPQSVSQINTSDEKGEFSTVVAPGAHEIDVFVAAPGFALKFFHTHIRDGALLIGVDQRGGRVTVAAPHDGDRRHPYLVHNGMWYPADVLVGAYAQEASGQVIIPSIDPGAYSLCTATFDEARAARNGITFARPCQNAFLAPYGTVTFDNVK